jgi:hypothetical protein
VVLLERPQQEAETGGRGLSKLMHPLIASLRDATPSEGRRQCYFLPERLPFEPSVLLRQLPHFSIARALRAQNTLNGKVERQQIHLIWPIYFRTKRGRSLEAQPLIQTKMFFGAAPLRILGLTLRLRLLVVPSSFPVIGILLPRGG